MAHHQANGTALVTGASEGIGAVYARRLAERGYDLVLVARSEAKLNALAAEIVAATGRAVEVLVADLADKADLRTVEARLKNDAAITLLVNNAGIAVFGPYVDADADAIERMIDLNITALTRLSLAAIPGLVARAGSIINIASVVPLLPERFDNIYSSTKAYVLNFTQTLQTQLAKDGVHVQAVLPGATATAIWEKVGQPVSQLPPEMVMATDEMVDAALAGFDQGELVTVPSLADPALWAAHDAARLALGPHLSLKHAAARFKTAETVAA
ncbi:SDR family oxidoreductase [Kaistia dalseonensis]|uniref:NADP-dependent 3-hydroxy acid dehydrogenase YdfG n=1 Tax=Kaistia dalseonensis TaxID=410840 RepID=A0ABU0HCU7_9HYPH|nr:SDR family oxidoreductase [Kaistia dalseonensis]MCX5496944.1 SDR family oxidoreductase [Kaistia dalseonensis]MDQ0439570.1 short-subunit dehydrogenase [Kaistia dalseonensis]